MKHYKPVLILVISLFSPVAFSDVLSTKIDALINQQLPHATVGVLVKDLQTGQIIYQKNEDKLLSPASNMKLFTAAAALYALTLDYQFSTTLSQKDYDFYITFTGDPSLTIENLNDLLSDLTNSVKKNGAGTIQGNIVLDVSRFQLPDYPNGTSYDDLGWYYAAPDSAVILDENAVDYDFISAKTIGMPVQIKPTMPGKTLNIINQVITADKDQAANHCSLNIEMQSHNTLRLFGCLVQNPKPLTMQLAVPDPILLAKQVIKENLDKNNIILNGQIIVGQTPSDAKIIASVSSDNLIQLITHMLQESDNLYANSLTRLLGYSVTGEGTFKQGAFAIKQILSQHTNIDWTQTEIADGMGTRYNFTTPEQMVVLLTNLYHDKTLQSIFLEALPQAGVSGTLKNRMKKTSLEKIVLAKTGTMHDISSLSGYIINSDDKQLVFSVIINGINKPIGTARTLEEQILQTINDSFLEKSAP